MAPHRPAPMDAKATEEMNLKVMTRIDPATDEILASAGHVALYDFNMEGQTWARKDVEGSLFLQKRRSAPTYQFTILNKKSQCNYTEEVSEALAFEQQNEKYILYRNVHEQVLCMWFHSADDCAKVATLLQRMTSGDLAQASSSQASGSQPTRPLPAGSARSAPAAATTNGSRSGNGNDSFWDQASSSMQAKELQSTDAALNGSSASASGPSSGSLHKLFSNIKLAPGVTPQHPPPPQQSAPQQSAPAIPMPQRNPGSTLQRQQQRDATANGSQQLAARAGSGALGVSPPSPAPVALSRISAGSAATQSGGGATPGKCGPPARPQLLTPSFFKQSAPQREPAGAASPLPFSLGAASAGQRASSSGPTSGAAATLAPVSADTQQRQAVRRAVLALVDQEPFLDMVGAALQQAGYKL